MSRKYGRLLRDLRLKAGKSMGELARHLGVSVTYISDVERGNRAPLTKENTDKAAQFLNADPRPLYMDAAEWHGAFELEANAVSPKAREVGASLMRDWSELTDKDLEEIAKILGKKGALFMLSLPRGFPTDRPLSYAKIEQHARRVCSIIAPTRLVTEALPGLGLFEHLNTYTVRIGDQSVPLDYEVKNFPSGIDALARYEEQEQEIVVTLSESTYENLEGGDPRARLTLCHEIGHAVLHTRELLRLSRISHREAALLRGEKPSHKTYQYTEWQANAFASAILMPAQGLAVLETQGKLSQSAVQRCYEVSALAAKIRLKVYQERKNELLR